MVGTAIAAALILVLFGLVLFSLVGWQYERIVDRRHTEMRRALERIDRGDTP